MKSRKKKYIAFFATFMFAIMMVLNVTTSINGSDFSIDGYTAVVNGGTGGGDYYMSTTYCWVTNQVIWKCKSGSGLCCVSCQDTCSSG